MQNYNTLLKQSFTKISDFWDQSIIPTLCNYIKIPNKSVFFDANWEKNGYMKQAMQLLINWCHAHPVKGMTLDCLQSSHRTPLLFITVPGTLPGNVLLYGHMDKQPEMTGWDEDKGPWTPVIQDDKLYGRGGADDGYALFAAMNAIQTLQQNKIPHPRCVILIEASEESGSIDLEYYLLKLKQRIGDPDLIICLDSGAGNYEQLWSTTSLRGVASGTLQINVLTEGIHSGIGSGMVPSVFLILRQLLDRIENSQNGNILLPELQAQIPHNRLAEAQAAACTLAHNLKRAYPLADHTKILTQDPTACLLNRSWHPALSITGIEGVPPLTQAGNVTLPAIAVKLSMRLPPTVSAHTANEMIKNTLETNPPFNATIRYTTQEHSSGWNAPALSDTLAHAQQQASQLFFNRPPHYIGEGGTIPFMNMLGNRFPKTQFFITGVLGPASNAHGPNEFLNIKYAKKITACTAYILSACWN